MKQTRHCNRELGHQNERLASYGQARTRSAGVPCIRRRQPHGEEDTKTYRGMKLHILHTQQS